MLIQLLERVKDLAKMVDEPGSSDRSLLQQKATQLAQLVTIIDGILVESVGTGMDNWRDIVDKDDDNENNEVDDQPQSDNVASTVDCGKSINVHHGI